MSRLTACLSAVAVSALLCGTALAATPDPANITLAQSVDNGVREAQAKRAAGDYPGAIKVLSQLMLVSADDARVVGEYGKVLVQQGRINEAIDFLRRAVQLQTNDWTYYSALGVALDQKGDYPGAKTAYEHALVLKPGESAILNNYAMSRLQAGDLDTAKSLIGSATAASKDERIARNARMIASLKLPASKQAGAAPNPAPTKAAASTAPRTLTQPRPITPEEGRTVVMQAVPKDPLAGPVGKPKTKATASTKQDKPKPGTAKGIPALRLAGDH